MSYQKQISSKKEELNDLDNRMQLVLDNARIAQYKGLLSFESSLLVVEQLNFIKRKAALLENEIKKLEESPLTEAALSSFHEIKTAKHGIDIGEQMRNIINEISSDVVQVASDMKADKKKRRQPYVAWSGTVKMPLSPQLLKQEFLVIKVIWDDTSERKSSSGYYAVEEMPVEKRYYNVVVVNASTLYNPSVNKVESILSHELTHASDPKKYHQHYIDNLEELALSGQQGAYYASPVEFEAFSGDIIERINRVTDTLIGDESNEAKVHDWLVHILSCLRSGDISCIMSSVTETSSSAFAWSVEKNKELKKRLVLRIFTTVQENLKKLNRSK